MLQTVKGVKKQENVNPVVKNWSHLFSLLFLEFSLSLLLVKLFPFSWLICHQKDEWKVWRSSFFFFFSSTTLFRIIMTSDCLSWISFSTSCLRLPFVSRFIFLWLSSRFLVFREIPCLSRENKEKAEIHFNIWIKMIDWLAHSNLILTTVDSIEQWGKQYEE